MKDDPEFNVLFVSLGESIGHIYDYICQDNSDRTKQELVWEEMPKYLNEIG